MEVVEDPSALKDFVDNVKNNVIIEEPQEQCTEVEICTKPNGLVEDNVVPPNDVNKTTETLPLESDVTLEKNNGESTFNIEAETTIELPSTPNTADKTETVINQIHQNIVKKEENDEVTIDDMEKTNSIEIELQESEVVNETSIEELSVEVTTVESMPVQEINNEIDIQSDNTELSEEHGVRFKTEVIVEVDENEVKENDLNKVNSNEHVTKNLLSELDQSIELSEVLRSSDVTENVENNNCSGRHEVFNKEELLDILQGKDIEPSTTQNDIMEINAIKTKSLEAQLALQQLTRLKNSKKKNRIERIPKAKKCEKKEEKKIDSIINVLVKDWDEEETTETDKSTDLNNTIEADPKDVDDKDIQLQIVSKEELHRTSVDSTTSEDNNQKSNKFGDENQPQKRLGRIIKKKVIFDPDNPDTFTKSKTFTKNRDANIEKEHSPNKKIKTEASMIMSKSKSPITKLQWKKPSPKNVKQNKRLSEVDKLLMDEGAVNMIYQLTPEAPKGKKNVKTKAEFIKKLQSSTPDSKEMKFRERKKDSSKYDDGEAKRILGGKHRVSLCSSVKSPSVCEDFETHSADDSIIYRRHSSSSYSSTCMSPRRLSDVDSSGMQSTLRTTQIVVDRASKITEEDVNDQVTDAFMSESTKIPSSEIINRDDCLSIKEKLNSKLSLALNKRKRESNKNDKPSKQKKVKECDTPKDGTEINFKSLSINIDQRLAEICIQNMCKYNVGVIRELEQALLYVNGRKDISVTLLTSQCGTLCSSLDLRPLLDEDEKKRTINGFEIAESIRSLLSTVEQHTKLLCTGVWGACCGVALALVARSDLALGSERATFSLAPSPQHVTLQPGLAAITASCNTLSQSLINDLVFFGRRISAAEAQQGGLLSRCLWPEHLPEQLRSIVRDIADQPAPNILLKKQLLGIRKNSEVSTFLSCLETERDLLIDYWTSTEGQELLRADQESA